MKRAKFKEIKKSGSTILKSQLSDLMLVWFLVTCGRAVISTIAVILGGFIVYGPSEYGMYRTFLRAAAGEKVKPQDVLDGFRNRFGESFLAGLVIKVIEFIPGALLSAVIIAGIATLLSASTVMDFIDLGLSKGTLTASLISIVAILILDIACLILRFAFSMAIFITVKEENITAFEALKKSGSMMKGEKFRLFRFDLSFILWFALMAITSGIASFWVMPYYTESKVLFFSEIYKRKSEEWKLLEADERNLIEDVE